MCKKPFDSIIFNVAFFLITFAGLVATSGAALRLGGIHKSKTEPENTEYSFYSGESGFFIGVKSAAFIQWMTAGFVPLFANVNASYFENQRCERITVMCFQNFMLLALFGGLHYFTLPMSVQNELNCMDIKGQFIGLEGLKGSKVKNPLCDADHSWDSLFIAFSLGASICFVGFLLLQAMYFCVSVACEKEVVPNADPVTDVPVVVAGSPPAVAAVEMLAIPAPL